MILPSVLCQAIMPSFNGSTETPLCAGTGDLFVQSHQLTERVHSRGNVIEQRKLGKDGSWVSAIGRRNSPRFQGENFQKNLDLVARVEAIAKEKKCKPGQLALAWLLAQGKDIIPIPGTKRRKYLEENAGALNVKLSQDDLKRIDEVAPRGAAAGLRYPEPMMQLVGR